MKCANFMKHVIDNKKDIVAKYLQEDESINDKQCRVALWVAAKQDYASMCELLIKKFESRNIPKPRLIKAFYNACRCNSLSTVKVFVKFGFTKMNEVLDEALAKASNSGASDVVEWLISENELLKNDEAIWRLCTKISKLSDSDKTAAEEGNETLKLTKLLVSDGNSTFDKRDFILQVLLIACNNSRLNFINWMLENDIVNSVLIYEEQLICKLLVAASSKGHLAVVEQLLRKDWTSSLDKAVDEYNDTILHFTIWKNDNVWNDNDLFASCKNGDENEWQDILMKKNPKFETSIIDQQDNDGRTFLHHACLLGHVNIVKILLSYFARTDITSYFKETPLEQALHSGNFHLTQILLQVESDKENYNKRQMNKGKFDSCKVIIGNFEESENDFTNLSSLLRFLLDREPEIVNILRLTNERVNRPRPLLVQFKHEDDCTEVLNKASKCVLAQQNNTSGIYIYPE